MPETQSRDFFANAHRFAPPAADGEHVYGACAPGWHSAATQADAVTDWIGFMRSRDVERVCCLLSGDRLDDPGGPVEAYRDAFGPDAVRHAPIADNRLANPALLDREILPFLDDAATAEQRVVVHGLSGIARTGQVLAAWLAHDRGHGPERAVETVEDMGRDPRRPVRIGAATEAELHDLLAIFS